MLRFKKLNSQKLIAIKSPEKYRVKWDASCRSNFQKIVIQFFKPYCSHHQVFEELPVPGTNLRIDLIDLNSRVVIESNGTQHDKYNKFFHRGSVDNFLDQIQRDEKKRSWAEHNNFQFVEIYESDLPLTAEFMKEKFGIIL